MIPVYILIGLFVIALLWWAVPLLDERIRSRERILGILDRNEQIGFQKAFIIGISGWCFRTGQPAEIIGVEFVTPYDVEPFLAYRIRFVSDGFEDIVNLDFKKHYKIISEEEMRTVPSVQYFPVAS